MKFKLPTYVLEFWLAVILILNTMLSPAVNPQVDGSALPLAMPVCQAETTPVETDTGLPHVVIPLVDILRYT